MGVQVARPDLDALAFKHEAHESSHGLTVCRWCDEEWPCDAADLLALVRQLSETAELGRKELASRSLVMLQQLDATEQRRNRYRDALIDLEGFLGGMRCNACDLDIDEAHRRARAALYGDQK